MLLLQLLTLIVSGLLCMLKLLNGQLFLATTAMAPKGSMKGHKGAAAKAKADNKAKDPKAAEERRTISNFITQMSKSTDPNKQSLISHYKSLSRFDEQKKEILQKWWMDKTCSWSQSYLKEITSSTASSSTEGQGFGTKYQAAKILSMDLADPSLDVVLQGIPHNMDWNLEDPLEHGYHTAGLKRFDLSYLRAHQTKQTTVEKKETLSATQWASKAKVSLEDEPPEQQATIKFEFPMHASLKAIVPVLHSMKGHLIMP